VKSGKQSQTGKQLVGCNTSYIGDIGRTHGTRLDEDKKEVETMTTRHFTQDQRNG